MFSFRRSESPNEKDNDSIDSYIDETAIEGSFDSDIISSDDASSPVSKKTPQSSISKTSRNKNRRSSFNEPFPTPKPQKPRINSDSSLKKNLKSVADNVDDSFIRQRKPRPILESDSDSSDEWQMKTRPIVDPDSDEGILVNETKEPTDSIESDLSSFASAEEQHENSDNDKNDKSLENEKNDEVCQTEQHEIDFRDVSQKVESTVLETAATPSPAISAHIERSPNRSVDTPRLIKHMKQSKTPTTSGDSFVPKFQGTILQGSSGDDQEIDVIDITSEDELQPARGDNLPGSSNRIVQPPTRAHFEPVNPTPAPAGKNIKEEVTSNETEMISRQVYQQQQSRVNQFQSDVQRATNVLRTVNLDLLPDKEESIRGEHQASEQALVDEVKKLSKMTVKNDVTPIQNIPTDTKNSNIKIPSWEEIEAKAATVQPKTFGKQAMSTYNAQKSVTMDKLHQLHGSLKTCPKETDLAEDPKGLKVELMHHQKHALAWLMWREKQQPSGGILADDMGLGKTLTMISLLLKTREVENDESDDSDSENPPTRSTRPDGGTLVVCPASLINQWSSELERRTKRGLASYEMYHGPRREINPKRLAKHDMVITTYAIVSNECDNGTVFRVLWRRIILDEAHQIRNHKSQTSDAVCKLSAKSRWALTGTPVHNKELDMYALLKFIRCTPFDDLSVWKRWVGNRSTGGQERLHTVISSLMLRRTKAELMEKGAMTILPQRKWELIPVQLTKSELEVYNRILIFSRTLFAQFLHQRAEKRQDGIDLNFNELGEKNNAPNQEYFKMRAKLLRLHKVKPIKQHDILVLLLRLRQICCHTSLITGMLHEGMDEEDYGSETHNQELDLLEQLNKLALDEDENDNTTDQSYSEVPEEGTQLKDAIKGWLNPNNPIFAKDRASSKIEAVIEVLKAKVLPTDDKAIIVSQWPSYLDLIAYHLKHNHVKFDKLDGKVPVPKRMEMVDCFNNPKNRLKVLLLSLTAGGVGLNLIGGNHLLLLDVHWNPQLENQAQDRIYRVGQKKPVYVYKFLATDTIEKRILDLQKIKLSIAEAMLTGSKQAIVNKLTLEDLKMLFEM